MFKVRVEATQPGAAVAGACGDVPNGAGICISWCQRLSADVAHTPMPKNPSTNRANRPEPVPVGLFLALTHRPRRCPIALPGVPDWHGLSPGDVAYLIRHYTRFGDVVLDLDEHPTIAAAARYLRRAPAKLVTHGGTSRTRQVAPWVTSFAGARRR